MNGKYRIFFIVYLIGTSCCYAQSVLDSTWSVPVFIASAQHANYFQTAMDGLGNTFLVWDTDQSLYVSRYDVTSTSWPVPEALTNFSESPYVLFARANNRGQAIVAWEMNNTEPPVLYLKRYSPLTRSWTNLPSIALDTSTIIMQCTLDDSGNIMILKQNTDPDVLIHYVYAVLYQSATGRWTDEIFLYELPFSIGARTLEFSDFSLNGNGLIVYGSSVKAFSYDATKAWPTGWQGPVSLFTHNSKSNSVAVDATGNGLAVCCIDDEVQASFYDSTQNQWSVPYTLYQSSSLENPNIETTMNANGNGLTAWAIAAGSTENKVITARFDAQQGWPLGWSTCFELTSTYYVPFLLYDQLQVALDSHDNGMITWLYYMERTLLPTNGSRAFDASLGWPNGWLPQQTPSFFVTNHRLVSNAQGNAWSLFRTSDDTFQGAQRIQVPTNTVATVIPGEAVKISAGADDVGTLYIACVETKDAQDAAYLLIHEAGDSGDIWSSQAVSTEDQHVSSVDISVNLIDNSSVAYIADTDNGGQCWVKIDDNDVVQVSPDEHNASHAKTYISNESDEIVAAVSYIDTTSNSFCFQESEAGDIYVVTCTGDGWILSPQLSDEPSQNQKLVIDIAKDVYVVWQTWKDPYWVCQATATDGNNNWQFPAKTLSQTDKNAVDPVIAVSNDGQVIFAWILQNEVSDTAVIQATVYNRSVLWNNWQPSIKNLSDTNMKALNPAVATDSAGNTIITWQIFDGVNSRIQAALYDGITNSWTILNTADSSTGYISPEGIDAVAPQVTMGFQGYGAITYNLIEGDAQTSAVNFFTQQTQLLSSTTKTGISGSNLGNPLAVIYYNNGTAIIALSDQTTTQSKRGSAANNVIKITLYAPPSRPVTPTGLKAKNVLNRFPRQADLSTVLTWDPVSHIDHYEIYDYAGLHVSRVTVPASDNPCAIFHKRNPCVPNTYYIYAVDSCGNMSAPASIMVS